MPRQISEGKQSRMAAARKHPVDRLRKTLMVFSSKFHNPLQMNQTRGSFTRRSDRYSYKMVKVPQNNESLRNCSSPEACKKSGQLMQMVSWTESGSKKSVIGKS